MEKWRDIYMHRFCFAYSDDRCKVLDISNCKAPCSFYKTKQQHLLSRRLANERPASLEEYIQRDIADKYYGGVMPWRESDSEFHAI